MGSNMKQSTTAIRIKSSTVRRPFENLCCRKLTQSLTDLIRVIRKGAKVKNKVDDAIDLCSEVLNLRDAIENARSRAEQATDERQKRVFAQKGSLSMFVTVLNCFMTSLCRSSEPPPLL